MNENEPTVPSTRIGCFRILEKIEGGAGSQGSVVKAVCEADWRGIVKKGTVVALKIMHASDDDGTLWAKLESRTRELASLRHENVVRYYGCFRFQNDIDLLHVIVQEYLAGETLKARLQRHKTGLDADEGLMVVKKAVEGLAYTAERGIVHRDVKPGNIFLCLGPRGRVAGVKLIDFEISRRRGGTVTTASGLLRGTFDYMAPEFADLGFRGDVQSDIFSMGVVMHEVFAGRLPYEKLDGDERNAFYAFMERWRPAKEEGKSPFKISNRINSIIAHANDVLRTALSFERAGRFPDFAKFRAGLDGIEFRSLNSPHHAYRILQWIGEGGFGVVFKGIDKKTGHIVAIKRLVERRHAARFSREARIVERLRDPCFVNFVEYFERDVGGTSSAYLVMDFLDGMPGNSLKDAIRRRDEQRVRYRDVLRAFMRYARGLKALHDAGIVHRDIKPANLYYPEGHPERSAIMDLGVALDVHGTITNGKYVPGTPDYMPPEVVVSPANNREKSRGDAGMDIFALGLSLYEALAGKPAYPRIRADDYDALFERAKSLLPPVFDDKRVVGNRALLRLLRDMTEPDCTRRLQDAGEVYARLKEIAGKLGVDGSKDNDRPVVAPSSSSSGASVFWKSLFAASVLVFLAAAGAFTYTKFYKDQQSIAEPGTDGPSVTTGGAKDNSEYQAFVLSKKLDKGLANEPISNRSARVDKAEEELKAFIEDNPGCLSEADYETYRSKIAAARDRIVGGISNACPFAVTVGARELKPDTSEVFAYNRDDAFEKISVEPEGVYERSNLKALLRGRGFEGLTIALQESDFTYKDVVMRRPALENGVSCLYNGSVVSPDGVKISPTNRSAKVVYRKADFKDQVVLFEVSPGKDGVLPPPRADEWHPTVVRYRIPKEDGVVWKINGSDYRPGDDYSAEPGKAFSYECQKQDYKPVTKQYVAKEAEYGKNVELKLPEGKEWHPAVVRYRIPEAEGVAVYINQERFYPGREYEVAPGTKFSYECRKDDYETVTKSYVAREDEYGQNKMLETPLASEWEETPALKAVNELERLYEKLELERSSKKLSKSTIEGVKERLKAAEKAVANDGNASGPLSGRLKVAAARVETLIALPDSGQQKNYHVKQARSLLESGDAEGFRHYIEAKTLGHKFTDDDMSTLYKYYGPVQAAGELAETYNERVNNKLGFWSSNWRASAKFCKVLDVLSQYGESKRKNDFVQEFERELKSKSNGAYEWFSKGWKDEKINGRETNREKYKIN